MNKSECEMKKSIFAILLLLAASVAFAQGGPVGAYESDGAGGWQPITTTNAAAALGYTPAPVLLYCFNSGLSQWTPATSACFGGGGGGSGTVTNIATTGPITGGPITTTGTVACPTCAVGPGASTANHLAKFSGTDGLTLADGGAIPAGTVTGVTATAPVTSSGGSAPVVACATCAVGPGTSTANHLAEFSGTDGVTLKDGGAAPASFTAAGDLSGSATTQTVIGINNEPVLVTISTSGPVTVGGVGFYLNNATGALTYNLPTIAAVSGVPICFTNAVTRTGIITLQAPASTFISLYGANGSAAGTLASSGALGDSACVVATSTTQYTAYLSSGTWNGINPNASFTAAGDLSGNNSSQTVIGLKAVPFCTGFTPTNGQNLEYTTGGTPNPCYSANTPSGAGNVVGPGSAVSTDIATYNGTSGTSIQDSGIGAASNALTKVNSITSASGSPVQINSASAQNIILNSNYQPAPQTLEYTTGGTQGAALFLDKILVSAGGGATAVGIGSGFQFWMPTTATATVEFGTEYVVATNDVNASIASDQITQLANAGTVATVRTLKSNGLMFTTGNSTTLASAFTTTSTSFVSTGLVLPSVPISTTIRGRCNLIWQGSSILYTTTFALGANNAPTDAYVMAASYSGANVSGSADPYTTITSTTTTAVTTALTPAVAATAYKAELDITLVTGGTNPVALTLYAQSSNVLGTTTVQPGSYCEWFN